MFDRREARYSLFPNRNEIEFAERPFGNPQGQFNGLTPSMFGVPELAHVNPVHPVGNEITLILWQFCGAYFDGYD